MMIRYERAWDPTENSPWCPLFTQEDLDLYNFRFLAKTHHMFAVLRKPKYSNINIISRQDLVFYYIRGYAYPITAQQTQVSNSNNRVT